MKRVAAFVLALSLMTVPTVDVALAAESPPAADVPTAEMVSQSLLSTIAALPASTNEQTYEAQLAGVLDSSGAPTATQLQAIALALQAPNLPPAAIAALKALQKKRSRPGATGNSDGSPFGGSNFGVFGSSDYTQ